MAGYASRHCQRHAQKHPRRSVRHSSLLKLVIFRHPCPVWKQMVVHQGLNKRYVRLSSLLEAQLSAVRLDPSQSLSTLDQDLDGVLVESSLVVNPDPKDLMAVQNRDRSDVGFVDSLEHWEQGALFFRQHSLDLLVSFLNRYQDSTHPGDELRLGFLMTGVKAEGVSSA